MEDTNKSKKKSDWFLGIIGIIMLMSFLIFFFTYFKNVSIGEWIAKENYSTNSEWLKQVGLFIATMVGFERFLAVAFEMYRYLPILHKKQSEDLRTKNDRNNKK